MKHFINLKDIPAKDLRKVIGDANMRLAGYTQDIRGAWKR